MASTIRTLTLECQHISLPVSLRGASEKQDVTLDTASEAGLPLKRIEVEDTPDSKVMVTRSRVVEVPPTGRQRKPRQVEQEYEVEAYIPYSGEKIKGVREGDEFFPVGSDEVEKIAELTKLDTLTINEFVPLADVPWYRATACYYLAPPKGQGAKTLATLRDAMENKQVAGVAKLMPKSRQKLALIHPKHGGLMVTVIAYSDTFQQVREGTAAISNVQVNDKVRALTEQLIDLMTEPVTVLDEYRDDLIDLKADLIERAKLGTPLVDEETAEEDFEEVERESATDDALLARLRESMELLAAERERKSPSREKAGV
jgi:Ku protein